MNKSDIIDPLFNPNIEIKSIGKFELKIILKTKKFEYWCIVDRFLFFENKSFRINLIYYWL